MAHTVFISYSTKTDAQMAHAVCTTLETAGIRCWMAPRNVPPSQPWPEAIVEAITGCEIMVLLYSEAASQSPEVAHELTRAGNARRKLIPVFLEDIQPEHNTFQYYLQNIQWLNAYDGLREEHLAALVTRVLEVLQGPSSGATLSNPSSRRQIWHVLYSRNDYFTGRITALDQLHRAYQEEEPQARTQMIMGLGGVGKKQLALEYCFRHRTDYPAILWTSAVSTAEMEAGFLRFAQSLDLPDKNGNDDGQKLKSVQGWLTDHRDYLLVLASVTDYEHVRKMLPVSVRGRLLLTTDIPDAPPSGGTAPPVLHEMESTEAVDFLLHRSGREGREQGRSEASALVATLGHLPLMLELAANYLHANPEVTMPHYSSFFMKADGTADASIAATWNRRLEAVSGSVSAKALLTLSAFLGPSAIPEEIALKYLRNSKDVCEATLSTLHRYFLVRRNPEDPSYDFNTILQEVTRNRVAQATQAAYAYNVIQIVHQLFPAPNSGTWEECERYVPHALACRAY